MSCAPVNICPEHSAIVRAFDRAARDCRSFDGVGKQLRFFAVDFATAYESRTC
jgi:hypothetical protein